jgi:hypothetical protein
LTNFEGARPHTQRGQTFSYHLTFDFSLGAEWGDPIPNLPVKRQEIAVENN